MKKKIIIPLSIIVLVFLVANIVTYAYSNENLFEFFFADNNAVQKKITNNLLTKEKQKIDQCSSVCRFWIPSTIYLDVSSDYTVYLWDLDHIYRLEWISNAY